jgi:hypothetical protein
MMVQPMRQEPVAPASAKKPAGPKVEEAAATSGDKVALAGLPPATKEKPASTKLAFGAGQNLKQKGDLVTKKRQTWSDRGSEKSRSPQRSIKKPISSKVGPPLEQQLTEEEKHEQLGLMDSFDQKLVMRLPNTGGDNDDSSDDDLAHAQS